MTAEEFVAPLEGVRRSGDGYVCRCPAHDDAHASLSAADGDKGVVVTCHANLGCTVEAIAAARGIAVRDLFYDSNPGPFTAQPKRVAKKKENKEKKPPPSPLTAEQVEAMHAALKADPAALAHVAGVLRFAPETIEAVQIGLHIDEPPSGRRWLAYPYRREDGTWTYAKLRSLGGGEKDFRRIPAGQSSAIYRAAVLPGATTATVFEGERDAVAAMSAGLSRDILSLPDGAKSACSRAVIEALKGYETVYVALDDDHDGNQAASDLAQAIGPGRCRRVTFKGFKDFGDALAALGRTAARDLAITAMEEAQKMEPEAHQHDDPPPREAAAEAPPPGTEPKSKGTNSEAKTLESYGIVPASTIIEAATSWLWEGFFPWGELSFIEGDPDVGKTTLLLSIVAAGTTGTPLPFGKVNPRNAVPAIFLTSEDSNAKTIVPRLKAAGANLDLVYLQKHEGAELLLPGAVGTLGAIVEATGARIVALDPLNAYLDASKVNINREQEVRRALRPLRDLAEKKNLAIIGQRHLNKKTDTPSLYRGTGSIGLAAVARSVVLVAKHPEDHGLRVVISQKCNLIEEAKKIPGAFRIRQDGGGRPRIEWVADAPEIDVDELLGPRKPGPKPDVIEKARRYLHDHLPIGTKKRRDDILHSAAKVGFNEKAMERAFADLKGLSEPDPENGKKRLWSLPLLS